MKAVARLCLTYGTAVPLQRWLGAIALLTVALSAAASPFGWSTPYLPATIGIAMYLVSVTFLGGYLLRELSAPLTHRLVPHFRVRMLAALLMVVLIVSAPSLLLLKLSSAAGPQHAGAVLLLITTGVMLLMFFPRGAFAFGVVMGPAVLLLAGLYERSGRAPFELLGAHARTLAVAIWAGVWLGFGAWYLRGTAISKAGASPPAGGFGLRGLADASGAFSKDDALRTTLTGGYPLRAKHRLLRLVLTFTVITVVMTLLQRFGSKTSGAYLLVLAGGVGISAPAGAERITRRTRALWLTSGESRRRLFARAERVLWVDTNLPALTMLLGLAVAAALAYHLPLAQVVRVTVLVAATGTLAAYVGLLFLHGVQSFVAAAVLLASPFVAGIWMTFSAPAGPGPLLAVAGLQLAAAGAARALAIRRWQRADWLAFRPIRVPSQSQRT